MSELKVGERVAVYESEFARVATTLQAKDPITGRFKIEVNNRVYWVHPKQCRRLVKRPLRRIWVLTANLQDFHQGRMTGFDALSFKPDADTVEFVEVRRKVKA